MPSARPRSSVSAVRQTSRSTAISLPAYQAPENPLNPAALYSLQSLPNVHSLSSLKTRIQTATNHLTEITGDLNDQHQGKKIEFEKQKQRRAARARNTEQNSSQGNADGNEDEEEEEDQQMQDSWDEVEDLTGKMEAGTRRLIDIRARVDSAENALKETSTNIIKTQSTLGASQNRAGGQRQQPRRGGLDNEDESDDQENDTGASSSLGPSALDQLKSNLSNFQSSYEDLSARDRYAENNNYIGFRKIVHDSRHPDDDTPLPHASTWFPAPRSESSNNLNPSVRQGKNEASNLGREDDMSDDSDAEIQIARERRTIRCPLTLRPMQDPLISTLCPHSFEKEAILSMLDASPLRATTAGNAPVITTQRGAGETAMKCPECEILLTASYLRQDPILIRKIKRLEAEARARDNDNESDDGQEEPNSDTRTARRAVQDVGSSPFLPRETFKREQTTQRKDREPSMVPGTQIVDLGDGEDEEEE